MNKSQIAARTHWTRRVWQESQNQGQWLTHAVGNLVLLAPVLPGTGPSASLNFWTEETFFRNCANLKSRLVRPSTEIFAELGSNCIQGFEEHEE